MSWNHMNNTAFAADIRSRIAELNDMLAEAHSRDLVITFRVRRENTRDNAFKPHFTLDVTTSQRI